MGSHVTKPSNKDMVDKLVERNCYIRSQEVEGAFRAIDRAMYFDKDDTRGQPYEDAAWKYNNIHISAPCIYGKVLEALELRAGLSFLNLGSGTGYLNTLVGLLVGPNGINHGIEYHPDVVAYAYNRLQIFKQKSNAIDKYDFVEPIFIRGNCLNLNPESRYDRIYLGAACLPNKELFIKKLMKLGGILVMPVEEQLMKYTRLSETEWTSEKLMDVKYADMIGPGGIDCDTNNAMIDMPRVHIRSLKELCRITIRQELREKTNLTNPNLLNSDNVDQRRKRRLRAQQAFMEREKALREKRKKRREAARKERASRDRYCLDCTIHHGSGQPSRSPTTRPTETTSKSTSTGRQNDTSSSQNRVVTRSASRQLSGGQPANRFKTPGPSSGNLEPARAGHCSGILRNMTTPGGSVYGGSQSDRVRGGGGSDSSRQDVGDSDYNNTIGTGAIRGRPNQGGGSSGGILCAMSQTPGSPLVGGQDAHHCRRLPPHHLDSRPGDRPLGRHGRHHGPHLHHRRRRRRRHSRVYYDPSWRDGYGRLVPIPRSVPFNYHSSDESIGWSEYEELERRIDRDQMEGPDWLNPYMGIDMLNYGPLPNPDSSLSESEDNLDGDDDQDDDEDEEEVEDEDDEDEYNGNGAQVLADSWDSQSDEADEDDNQSDEDDDGSASLAASSTYDVIELSDDGSIRSSSYSNMGDNGRASDDDYLSAANNDSADDEETAQHQDGQQQQQPGPTIKAEARRQSTSQSADNKRAFDQEPVASRLRSRGKIATSCRLSSASSSSFASMVEGRATTSGDGRRSVRGCVCNQEQSSEFHPPSHSLDNCNTNRHLYCRKCRVDINNRQSSNEQREPRGRPAANSNGNSILDNESNLVRRRHQEQQSVKRQASSRPTITITTSSSPSSGSSLPATGGCPLLSGRFLIATGIGATFSIGTRPSDWSSCGSPTASTTATGAAAADSSRTQSFRVATRRRQTFASSAGVANYRNLVGSAGGDGGAGLGWLRSPSPSPPPSSSSPMSHQQSLQQPSGSSSSRPTLPAQSSTGPAMAHDRKRKRHSSSSDSASSPSSSSSDVSSSRRGKKQQQQQQDPLPGQQQQQQQQMRRRRRRSHCRHRRPHCCHHQDRYSSPGRRRCYRGHSHHQRPCHAHNHSSGYLCRNHRLQYQHRHQLAHSGQHQQQAPSPQHQQQQQSQPQPARQEPRSGRLGEIAIGPELQTRRAGRRQPFPWLAVDADVNVDEAARLPEPPSPGPIMLRGSGGPSGQRRRDSLPPALACGKRKRRRRVNLNHGDEEDDDDDDDDHDHDHDHDDEDDDDDDDDSENDNADGNAEPPTRREASQKRKRRQDECEKYRSHISGYISQLPLPKVLLAYLNYERAL